MKKFSFKKVGIPIILIIAIVLSSVIAVWSMKRTDTVKHEDEPTIGSGASVEDGSFHYEESTEAATEEGVTEVSVETTILENGEVETRLVNVPVGSTNKETEKASDDVTSSSRLEYNKDTTHGYTKPVTRPVVIYTTKSNADNDKPVATTRKPVTTTKKPVETQVIKETTTKAPTTTKKPTTTKAEYYPSLTASDMEELKRYAISYIESRGYRADPDIKWDNAGYYVTCGVSDDLSSYGDKYKVNGGMSPLDFAKRDMKDAIDWHIEDWERANGPDSIYGMYPLVRRSSTGWQWTIGYW